MLIRTSSEQLPIPSPAARAAAAQKTKTRASISQINTKNGCMDSGENSEAMSMKMASHVQTIENIAYLMREGAPFGDSAITSAVRLVANSNQTAANRWIALFHLEFPSSRRISCSNARRSCFICCRSSRILRLC